MNNEIKIPNRVAEVNAEIARQGNKGFSVAASAPGYVPPTNTLNSTSLQSANPIALPPPTPAATTGAAINGQVDAKLTQAKTDYEKLVADQQAQAKGNLSGDTNSLKDYINQRAGILTDKATATQTPEFLAKKDAALKASNDLEQNKQAQLAEINAIKANPSGLTTDELNNRISSINDKYAAKNANLSITYDIANKDYTSAQDTIDKTAQLKMEALQPQIDYYSDLVKNDQGIFNQSEVNILQSKKDAYVKAQADAGNLAKQIGALQLEAAKNGAPQSIVQAIGGAKDYNTAIQAAGGYAKDLLQQAQIAKLNAEAKKAGTTGTTVTNGGVSQELQDAINNGTIDPNRINSRTLAIYNSIAKAGVDAVGSHAGAAGETQAITDLSTYKSTANRTLGVLESNLPLVEGLADKVNTIGTPALDAYVSGKKALLTNDPDVIKYVNSLKTLRAEYAQMLAKGNVATEGDKADAEQAIPAGLSSAGYAALGEQLKLEANNILTASDNAIKAAKNKSASNAGSNDPTPPPSVSPDLTSQFDNLFQQYGGK